jgi:flavin reductase (DIM6/NTAB) family NADH-FMN oxidoreductase RutF
VARRFATPRARRFTDDMPLLDGVPVVPDAAAVLSCRRQALVKGGDHTVVLAPVERAAYHREHPLIYHGRAYGTVSHLRPVPSPTPRASSGLD